MRRIRAFGDENNVVDRVHSKVSLGFWFNYLSRYESQLFHPPSEEGEEDIRLVLFESLERDLDNGISENELDDLRQYSRDVYVQLRKELGDEKFFELSEKYKSLEHIQFARARNIGEKMELLEYSEESMLYSKMPKAYQRILDRLSVDIAPLLIRALKKRQYCIANLSGITDEVLKNVYKFYGRHSYIPSNIEEIPDLLVYILRDKLLDQFGQLNYFINRIWQYTRNLNPQKVYWLALQVDNRCIFRPAYQIISLDTVLPKGEFMCTGISTSDCVIRIVMRSIPEVSFPSFFPEPMDLDSNIEFPLEEKFHMRNLHSLIWQFPFILEEQQDWEYLLQNGGNTVCVVQYWKPGRSFNEAMMMYLHNHVSASFPLGNYCYAVFPGGISVDLRHLFTSKKQETLELLQQNGFPQCRFE